MAIAAVRRCEESAAANSTSSLQSSGQQQRRPAAEPTEPPAIGLVQQLLFPTTQLEAVRALRSEILAGRSAQVIAAGAVVALSNLLSSGSPALLETLQALLSLAVQPAAIQQMKQLNVKRRLTSLLPNLASDSDKEAAAESLMRLL